MQVDLDNKTKNLVIDLALRSLHLCISPLKVSALTADFHPIRSAIAPWHSHPPSNR